MNYKNSNYQKSDSDNRLNREKQKQREDEEKEEESKNQMASCKYVQTTQIPIYYGKDANNPNWVIDELNLDQLLSDYAKRVAGGDGEVFQYSAACPEPAAP